MDHSSRVTRRPRRLRSRQARTAATVTATLGLALLAAACSSSGSPSSNGSGGSPSPSRLANSQSPSSQLLAFSHCMRSHDVPNFPDPNSSGLLPKNQLAQLAASNPQFPAAHRACEHLLPNGGQPTQAQVQQAWNDMRNFARCIRSHGVPNWPDPAFTSQQDHRPFFNLPNSIDPNAPQITTKIDTCQHLLHANNPLVTTQ
jgi:hypothetical protein